MFDCADKWHIHRAEYPQENDTHWILWNIEIQTDCQIKARRLEQVLVNKKEIIHRWVDFTVLTDQRVKRK